MGRHGKSSLFSFCSIFTSCFSKSSGDDTYSEEGVYIRRRICPSDEDRGGYFAEPGIDNKASDFIARFYESRASNPEKQTLAL